MSREETYFAVVGRCGWWVDGRYARIKFLNHYIDGEGLEILEFTAYFQDGQTLNMPNKGLAVIALRRFDRKKYGKIIGRGV